MKNEMSCKWILPLLAILLVVPGAAMAVGSQVKTTNPTVYGKAMPRPEAWDYIDIPQTAPVTAANPLKVDLCLSYRSPYSVIGIDRFAAMDEDYNADFTVRFVFPLKVHETDFFRNSVDYRFIYDVIDAKRSAEFNGVAYFRGSGPDEWIDPVVNVTPTELAPREDQIYIYRLIRNGALLQKEYPDKSMRWAQLMLRKIWGGESYDWPSEIPKVLTELGLDATAFEAKAEAMEEELLELELVNRNICAASGHRGVPNAIFRGEPFFGQDRIDQLLWRLKKNGLTKHVQ